MLIANGICTAVQTASSAIQGPAALEQFCEKCRKGQSDFGSDPCSQMSASKLEGVASGGRTQFKKLEHESQQISDAIKAYIASAGHDTDQNQVLGATLRIVNSNLHMLRQLKVKNLSYDPAILEAGLLKHTEFFQEVAQKLEMNFRSNGFNRSDALTMIVYNPGREEVVVAVPAGAVFEPVHAKHCQNLVLKNAATVRVNPGQKKTIGLWALCGNHKASPPGGGSPGNDFEPTDYVLNCDLSSQSSVWKAKTV